MPRFTTVFYLNSINIQIALKQNFMHIPHNVEIFSIDWNPMPLFSTWNQNRHLKEVNELRFAQIGHAKVKVQLYPNSANSRQKLTI